MKALIFSDIEVHPYQEFGSEKRLKNCLDVITGAFDLACSEEVDCIMFCGDLTDQPGVLPISVVNRLTEVFQNGFREVNIPFFSISGNHDQPKKYRNHKKHETTQDFLDRVFDNYILLDNRIVQFKGFRIRGIPYYDERFPDNFLDSWNKMSTFDICLTHQAPEEVDVPYDTLAIPVHDGITFNGHVHEPKILRKDLVNVGAGLSKSFGDTGDRFYWIAEFDKEGNDLNLLSSLRQVETGMPKFGHTEDCEFYREKKELKARTVEIDVNLSREEMLRQWSDKNDEAKKYLEFGLECLS